MQPEDLIADFVLLTGVIWIVTVARKREELRRQLATGSIIFRWFQHATVAVAVGWSTLSLGLQLAGKATDLSLAPYMAGLLMVSWWPFLFGVWSFSPDTKFRQSKATRS
ncbi:hypothetical protein Pan44_17060 [Caulifigura coniformis]|uniref:Uncharacterized protein n=1 Tax=Caulifigura coniformis TaxID=2527983 RepID=A0A517SC44_9PLAN|nr:hypothetical protein [Caulifigura coniformis]QDT53683.1 hypothetical protein Pan44_17060 [Caulifigura coniformis]